MDQPKIQRELQLLMLLANNKYTTQEDICNRLNISERTLYRYIDTFREAGFVVKKDDKKIYKLEINDKVSRQLGDLLYFSEEEAYLLKSAIDSIEINSKFKESLKKKLYAVYDYKLIAAISVEHADQKKFEEIQKAIDNRKQVCLKSYRSAHSNRTSDRYVEPYAITSTMDQVWCYEIDTQMVKMFKISRIKSVEILEKDWKFEAQHKTGYIDIFRIHSTQRFPITLRLTLRAANLLMEEYPLSNQYLKLSSENNYILKTDVCSFEGVTRFILGLYDDIEILESEELKNFVNYKIKMLNR